MLKRLPFIILILSIVCLLSSLLILYIGSKESQLYNQMKKSKVVTDLKSIKELKEKPFLLSGSINQDHETTIENFVSYYVFKDDIIVGRSTNNITISLKDGDIILKDSYELADFNNFSTTTKGEIKGIKVGSDITIFAVAFKEDGLLKLKGHKLYPGRPDQYINFLSSPFNSYMVYVRVLIALALIFFCLSIVINIKK